MWPSASVAPIGLGNAALTAALLPIDDDEDLYVRFTIEQGEPTLLTRIVMVGDDGKPIERGLCSELLRELAAALNNRDVATRLDKDRCAATIGNLTFRTDEVAATRDRLRDFLFKTGRARGDVEYAPNRFCHNNPSSGGIV